MTSGHNEKWSKLKVVIMKSGDKWLKLKAVNMKSGQN